MKELQELKQLLSEAENSKKLDPDAFFREHGKCPPGYHREHDRCEEIGRAAHGASSNANADSVHAHEVDNLVSHAKALASSAHARSLHLQAAEHHGKSGDKSRSRSHLYMAMHHKDQMHQHEKKLPTKMDR